MDIPPHKISPDIPQVIFFFKSYTSPANFPSLSSAMPMGALVLMYVCHHVL